MRLVEVGLLIIPFAFMISFFGGLQVGMDSWRIVDLLLANPQIYMYYIQVIVLYLIFPPAISLTLTILGYSREKEFSKKIFSKWPSIIIGGIPIIFGFLILRETYYAYYNNMSWLHSKGIQRIDTPLLMIYGTEFIAGILWLFLGVLILYFYASQKLG